MGKEGTPGTPRIWPVTGGTPGLYLVTSCDCELAELNKMAMNEKPSCQKRCQSIHDQSCESNRFQYISITSQPKHTIGLVPSWTAEPGLLRLFVRKGDEPWVMVEREDQTEKKHL